MRSIEREILTQEHSEDEKKTINPTEEVVLDYCSAIRGILNSNQGSPVYPAGLRMVDSLKQVRESLQVNINLKRATASHTLIERLAKCIDKGFETVKESLEEIHQRVQAIRAVDKSLDPKTGSSQGREESFNMLMNDFTQKEDTVSQHMAKIMKSFRPGLFAGGDELDMPEDNLDLERWFKNPKSHERRIHGHRHAGTRIVQEGPTKMLALDAHLSHPHPFSQEELKNYYKADIPEIQKAAIHRRKIMRNARSKKRLKFLLQNFELRYLTDP